MSIFRRIFRIDPQRDFGKGRKAFDQGKYALASDIFQKTYKYFDTSDMKVISLENAAVSAEYADMYEKSQELFYQLILLKLSVGHDSKDVILDIDKAIQMTRLSKKPSIPLSKLFHMKFLIFLSEKEFKKLESLYKKLNLDLSDKYFEAIEKTWTLIHSTELSEKKEGLPRIDISEEFSNVMNTAEQVMQKCTLCEILIDLSDESKIIQKGVNFSLAITLTALAPISIQNIHLKTGTKGRIIDSSTPELPLNLSTNENYSMIYSLIPNLPGEWLIGPMSISYSLPAEQGEFPVISKSISVLVEDAAPALKLSMDSETIEEDLEYLVVISAENIGKTTLQDVRIVIEIPDEIKISEGTKEKYISTLGEGETFQYEVGIRFSLEQTHFSGHVIKVNGFIGNNQRLAKSSIKLGDD